MDTFNLNIDAYRDIELENLMGLTVPYSHEDVTDAKEVLLRQLTKDADLVPEKNRELSFFIDSIASRLDNGDQNHYKLSDNPRQRPHDDDKGTYAEKKVPIAQYGSNIIIKNSNEIVGKHAKITQGRIAMSGEVPPGYINPINVRTTARAINIDSRFRPNYYKTSSTQFSMHLPAIEKRVVRMTVGALEIPLTYHAISERLGNNKCLIIDNSSNLYPDPSGWLVTLPDGIYGTNELKGSPGSAPSIAMDIEIGMNNAIATADAGTVNINTGNFTPTVVGAKLDPARDVCYRWDRISGRSVFACPENASCSSGGGGGGGSGALVWTERLAGFPNPPERRWKGIASNDSGDQLIACEQGSLGAVAESNSNSLYTSADSGVTWQDVWQPRNAEATFSWAVAGDSTTQSWKQVASATSTTILWAAPGIGNLWSSTDAGVTWTDVNTTATTPPLPINQDWRCISVNAAGTTIAAAAYGGNIWTSTDSGVNWVEATGGATPPPPNENWNCIALSGAFLCATIEGGALYKSSSAPYVSWVDQSVSAGAPASADWRAISGDQSGFGAVAVAYNGYIWSSNPGLTTWSVFVPNIQNWTGVAMRSTPSFAPAITYTVIACVEAGNLWLSTDYNSLNGTATWIELAGGGNFPTPNLAWTSVAIDTDGTDMLATAGTDIWLSTNSGTTWQQNTPAAGGTSWSSTASNTDGSIMYASRDGGAIWKGMLGAPIVGYDNSMGWVSVCSSTTGTNLGAITYDTSGAYSTDTGATWTYFTDLSSAGVWGRPETDWNTIVSNSAGNLMYACSARGPIKSWNVNTWSAVLPGVISEFPLTRSWSEKVPPSSGPVDTARRWKGVASNSIGDQLIACEQGTALTGLNRALYRSTDTGDTWTDVWTAGTSPAPFDSGLNWTSACTNAAGDNLGAVTFDSSGAFSTNSGGAWTYFTDLSSSSYPYAVTDTSYNTIVSSSAGTIKYVCSGKGAIKKSSDSGLTWSLCSGPTIQFPTINTTTWTDISLNVIGGGNPMGQDFVSVCTSSTGENLVAVSSSGGKPAPSAGITFPPPFYSVGYGIQGSWIADASLAYYDRASRIVRSDDTGQFVVRSAGTASEGRLERSTDFGSNWTTLDLSGEVAPGVFNYLTFSTLGCNVDGSVVATTTDGVRWIMVSEDSTSTWTNFNVDSDGNPFNGDWANQGGVCNSVGDRIVVFTKNKDLYTGLKSGGSWTWTIQPAFNTAATGTVEFSNRACMAGNAIGDRLYVGGPKSGGPGGAIITSSDYGVTWSDITPAGIDAAASGSLNGISCSGTGQYVLAATGTSAAKSKIWSSYDYGVTWSDATSPPDREWGCVALNANGSRAIAGVGDYNSGGGADVGEGLIWMMTTTPSTTVGEWTGMCCDSTGTKIAACTPSFIYVSTDSGTTLTQSQAGAWAAISCSDDFTKLAAVVGAGGTSGRIWLSTDSGTTWTEKTGAGDPPSSTWRTVAISGDGNTIAAAVGGDESTPATVGPIYVSNTAGATWVEQTTLVDHNWQSIASNIDGEVLAAGVGDGQENPPGNLAGNIWIGTGGVGPEWSGMCCDSAGTSFAACNATHIYTSTDSGTTLTQRQAGAWRAIACDSTFTNLAAVIGWETTTGNIWLSPDGGVTWTDVNVTATTPPPLNQHWRSITMSSDGSVIAAAIGGDEGDVARTGTIWLSTNGGVTWVEQTPTPGTQNWQSITSNADGSKLAAAVGDGSPEPPGSVVGNIWTMAAGGGGGGGSCECMDFTVRFTIDKRGNLDMNDSIQFKLGWPLGFRGGEYMTSGAAVSEGICYISGPRYGFLAINDYQKNRGKSYMLAFANSSLDENIIMRLNLAAAQNKVGVYKSANDPGLTTTMNTSRDYFGPVDIQKLTITLYDEYGRVIDLNNMNWSFSLTLERLYD